MSYSKPVPPFTFDVLCYLNRDQLERFSTLCRPLKNLIQRYFHSTPYRVFDRLWICGGDSYALTHNQVQWHPNRDDYGVQQFLAGQKCSVDVLKDYFCDVVVNPTYCSFTEMRPYLGPTIRIKWTIIYVAGASMYNPEHIVEMESVSYLWRDANISVIYADKFGGRIGAEDCARLDIPPEYVNTRRLGAECFQLILNSPTILQCQTLYMDNAHFSFKDYKILYAVNTMDINYDNDKINSDYWQQYLEQPVVKPVVVLHKLHRESIDIVLYRLIKAFSSAVLPNSFKIIFAQVFERVSSDMEDLTEFKETNKTSGEILELKKGLPLKFQNIHLEKYRNNYTLERSSI